MKINQINNQQNTAFNGRLPLPKRELIFFGPPACGKGTQTSHLSKELGLPHVDMGSMLRAAIASQSEEGKLAKSFIDKGQLVPIQVIGRIITNMLSSAQCKDGYILDGFPRNIEQAKLLEETNKKIDAGKKILFQAINFEINPKLLLERIVNRRSCPQCGEIYNVKFHPPKIENECDMCHIPLKQRADDTAEVAGSRFATYFEQTAPLIEHYQKKGVLSSIDADGSIEEVWQRLLSVLKR